MAVVYLKGTILWISQVPDKQGANPKDRNIVLIQDFNDTDTLLYGAAVTSKFSFPLSATTVRLPYRRGAARCKTGLTMDSVADCEWLRKATPQDVISRTGFTPSVELAEILKQSAVFLSKQQAAAGGAAVGGGAVGAVQGSGT